MLKHIKEKATSSRLPTLIIDTQVTETHLERELQVETHKEVFRIRNLLKECEQWNEASSVIDEEWPDQIYACTKEAQKRMLSSSQTRKS